jgi:hypothetical protein
MGWRGAALVPAATLAVHELRYLLAFGGGASHELAERGDTYVGWLAPLCALALAVPLGAVAGRLTAAWQGRTSGRVRGCRGRLLQWLGLGLVLLACFCVQEVVEQLLEPQHPVGLSGIVGDGGWWAVPAAFGLAAVLTLLMAGTQAVVSGIARRRAIPVGGVRAAAAIVRLPSVPFLAAAAPLAGGAAGRAPPGRSRVRRSRTGAPVR